MDKGMRAVLVGGILICLVVAGSLWAQPQATELTPPTRYPVEEPKRSSGESSISELSAGNKWSGGSSLGLLGSTPDGTAFAMNGNAEYFVNPNLSIGPLVQLAFTDDMVQIGTSGQGKYYIDLPGTGGRGRVSLQSGVGFVHSEFRQDDTSWLVPLGVGYDYKLNSGVTVTATSLVNFTNLHTGGGTGADVMPGFAFGVKF